MGAMARADWVEVLAPCAAPPFDRATRRRCEADCGSTQGARWQSRCRRWCRRNTRKLVGHVSTPTARQAASGPPAYSAIAAVQARRSQSHIDDLLAAVTRTVVFTKA